MGDELANDRTFLAWLRTGIALFGLGFVVAKVLLARAEARPRPRWPLTITVTAVVGSLLLSGLIVVST